MLMVSLLNHEYCLGEPQRMRATLKLPVLANQYQALARLTTAAEMMFLHCPGEIVPTPHWGSNIKCAWLNYGGSGGGVAEGVTAKQILGFFGL